MSDFVFVKGSDITIKLNGEVLGGVQKVVCSTKKTFSDIKEFLTDIPVARVEENRYQLVMTLNTPSLEEMITVVKELKNAGVNVPVMIAGATTSPLHTALKIAPAYDGAVVHVKDVSQNVVVAAELLGGDERREAFVAALKESQEALREGAAQKISAPLRSLDEARANKPNLF